MKNITKNIYGLEMLKLLRKGHMVRRSCWVEGFFIRICNEAGFDEQGDLIEQSEVGEDNIPIYTHATTGYFMHLAYSSQPFSFEHTSRAGEGIAMLFADDWEDHGFISSEDFNKLTERTKEKVRRVERSFWKQIYI